MKLPDLFWSIALPIPWLVLYLVATILGLVNLNRHKPAGLYVMLGGMMGGLATLGGKVATELLWANANKGGGDIEGTVLLTRLITLGMYLVEVVGIGMIVFAAFAGRQAVRSEPLQDCPRDRGRDRDRDDRDRERPS